MIILCVTEPNEPDSPTEGKYNEPTPPEAAFTDESEEPVQSTLPESDESDLLRQVLEKMQTMQMTENFVSQQFATMQVIQNVQPAKLATTGPTVATVAGR